MDHNAVQYVDHNAVQYVGHNAVHSPSFVYPPFHSGIYEQLASSPTYQHNQHIKTNYLCASPVSDLKGARPESVYIYTKVHQNDRDQNDREVISNLPEEISFLPSNFVDYPAPPSGRLTINGDATPEDSKASCLDFGAYYSPKDYGEIPQPAIVTYDGCDFYLTIGKEAETATDGFKTHAASRVFSAASIYVVVLSSAPNYSFGTTYHTSAQVVSLDEYLRARRPISLAHQLRARVRSLLPSKHFEVRVEIKRSKKLCRELLCRAAAMDLPVESIGLQLAGRIVLLCPSMFFPLLHPSEGLLFDPVVKSHPGRVLQLPGDLLAALSAGLVEVFLKSLYGQSLPTSEELLLVLSESDRCVREVQALVYLCRYLGLVYHAEYFIAVLSEEQRVGL